MGIEKTFVMLKPDGMIIPGVFEEIVTRLNASGLTVINQKIVRPTRELLREHYAEHFDNPKIRHVIENHADFIMTESEPFWHYVNGVLIPRHGYVKPQRGNLCMIFEGDGAVSVTRTLLGPTRPIEAQKTAPETLRAKYGCNYIENPGQDIRLNCFNVAHASGTPEEAEKEIKIWM